MNTRDYEQELIAVARPYWAAETEIPRRFVAGKPTRADYIKYLGSAVYKELNPAIGYAPPEGYACNLHEEFAVLVDQFPDLHNGADRNAIYRRLHMMIEEFNHYRVLADVLEFDPEHGVGERLVDGALEDDRIFFGLRQSGNLLEACSGVFARGMTRWTQAD